MRRPIFGAIRELFTIARGLLSLPFRIPAQCCNLSHKAQRASCAVCLHFGDFSRLWAAIWVDVFALPRPLLELPRLHLCFPGLCCDLPRSARICSVPCAAFVALRRAPRNLRVPRMPRHFAQHRKGSCTALREMLVHTCALNFGSISDLSTA